MSASFGAAATLNGWRNSKLLRRLQLAPVSTGTVVGARVAVTVGVALTQMAIFLGIGAAAFGLQLTGAWPAAIPLLVVGTLCFMSIGLLAGAVAKTTEGAVNMANFIVLPMAFLSGSFFPLDGAPQWLQVVSKLLPLWWLNEGMLDVMVRGEPASAVLLPMAVLGFFAVAGHRDRGQALPVGDHLGQAPPALVGEPVVAGREPPVAAGRLDDLGDRRELQVLRVLVDRVAGAQRLGDGSRWTTSPPAAAGTPATASRAPAAARPGSARRRGWRRGRPGTARRRSAPRRPRDRRPARGRCPRAGPRTAPARPSPRAPAPRSGPGAGSRTPGPPSRRTTNPPGRTAAPRPQPPGSRRARRQHCRARGPGRRPRAADWSRRRRARRCTTWPGPRAAGPAGRTRRRRCRGPTRTPPSVHRHRGSPAPARPRRVRWASWSVSVGAAVAAGSSSLPPLHPASRRTPAARPAVRRRRDSMAAVWTGQVTNACRSPRGRGSGAVRLRTQPTAAASWPSSWPPSSRWTSWPPSWRASSPRCPRRGTSSRPRRSAGGPRAGRRPRRRTWWRSGSS